MKKIYARFQFLAKNVSVLSMLLFATSSDVIASRGGVPAPKYTFSSLGTGAKNLYNAAGGKLSKMTGYNSKAGKPKTQDLDGTPSVDATPDSGAQTQAPTQQGGWNFTTAANKAGKMLSDAPANLQKAAGSASRGLSFGKTPATVGGFKRSFDAIDAKGNGMTTITLNDGTTQSRQYKNFEQVGDTVILPPIGSPLSYVRKPSSTIKPANLKQNQTTSETNATANVDNTTPEIPTTPALPPAKPIKPANLKQNQTTSEANATANVDNTTPEIPATPALPKIPAPAVATPIIADQPIKPVKPPKPANLKQNQTTSETNATTNVDNTTPEIPTDDAPKTPPVKSANQFTPSAPFAKTVNVRKKYEQTIEPSAENNPQDFQYERTTTRGDETYGSRSGQSKDTNTQLPLERMPIVTYDKFTKQHYQYVYNPNTGKSFREVVQKPITNLEKQQ